MNLIVYICFNCYVKAALAGKKTRIAQGKEALAFMWADLLKVDNRGDKVDDPVTVHSLEVFRMFKWLLLPAEQKDLDTMVATKAAKRKAEIQGISLVPALLDATPDGSGKKRQTEKAIDLQLAKMVPISTDSALKETPKGKKDPDSRKEKLMRLFCPKAKM